MFYNWNVIGHEKELASLENDIRNGSVHHAYLFVGPEKIGKFRIAKAVAGILQCPNNFCHACPACIQVEKKCHPDTIELEDDGESVGIDAVRDIITRLNMTGQSLRKILLIENIGRLTAEAGNCLLKTLEEPPQNTVFIFSAGQLKDIMPTISSRMRIMHFKKLHDEVLKTALKKMFPEIHEEMLDQVILLSLGRSGRAIQLLTEPEKFHELLELYHHVQFLEEKASIATRITAMQEVVQNPQKMKMFLSLLVHHLRKKMLEDKKFSSRMAALCGIEAIHTALGLAARNVNPRLLLENIMLNTG